MSDDQFDYVSVPPKHITMLPATLWRAIETAPKDGTEILVHDGDPDGGAVVAFWQSGIWLVSWGPEQYREPLVWHPIPAMPGIGETGWRNHRKTRTALFAGWF